jgi:hypothetical protein
MTRMHGPGYLQEHEAGERYQADIPLVFPGNRQGAWQDKNPFYGWATDREWK